MLKLSIIIPLYNTEDFIAETLNSIINQNCNGVEVIVIDDNSTDKGPQLVKEFCIKYDFIKLIKNDRKKGVSGARNTGILNANGEYIAFIDSDDIFLENAISENITVLDRYPKVNFLSSDFVKFKNLQDISSAPGFYAEKENVTKGLVPYRTEKNLYLIPDPIQFYIDVTCPIWTGSVIVRNEHLNKIGLFDETLSQGEDMELWYRLTVNTSLLFNIHASTAYRMREGSAISLTYERHQGMCQFINQIYNNPLFRVYKKGIYLKVLQEHVNFIYYCRSKGFWNEALRLCFYLISLNAGSLIVWRQIIAILLKKK